MKLNFTTVLICLCCFGAVNSFAQSKDSTKSKAKDQKGQVAARPSAAQSQTNSTVKKEVKSYPTKDMVKVSNKEISEGLKNTLEGNAEYAGWQEGTIYYNPKNKEYSLLLPSISEATYSSKEGRVMQGKKNARRTGWHHFTYEGKPIHESY
jgi:hypothetical protein